MRDSPRRYLAGLKSSAAIHRGAHCQVCWQKAQHLDAKGCRCRRRNRPGDFSAQSSYRDALDPDISLVLVDSKSEFRGQDLPDVPVASLGWLEACLAQRERLPTDEYVVAPSFEADSDEAAGKAQAIFEGGPLRKFEPWLGFWEPEFDSMHQITEIVLQARFSAKRSLNEPLVECLTELCKFETAIWEERSADDSDGPETINHKALQYARAAAICRACAFPITESLEDNKLPFVGPASARVIRDILSTGTCPELEAFRSGNIAHNSKGAPRPETEGANIRRMFKKLPGVGISTAEAWWRANLTTYEEAEAHARAQGEESKKLVTKIQAFSLAHRGDLLEDCPEVDIDEMQQEVIRLLEELTGEGWQLWLVGGARRGTASHDADFVVSHPSWPLSGVLRQLVTRLQAEGRLVEPARGLCLVQEGRLEKPEDFFRSLDEGRMHNLRADRYDRVVGIFITSAGKLRRMDVILPPWPQVPFCLISWTGSKQYNRFLRQHAINRGMNLNAHSLIRRIGGGWRLLPDQAAPLDRSGSEFWPTGWPRAGGVTTEADVFELLGVPYRDADERSCP